MKICKKLISHISPYHPLWFFGPLTSQNHRHFKDFVEKHGISKIPPTLKNTELKGQNKYLQLQRQLV